jgi:pilus assembly protein CpaC
MSHQTTFCNPLLRRRLRVGLAALLLALTLNGGCLKSHALAAPLTSNEGGGPQTPPSPEASSTSPEEVIQLDVGRSRVLTSPVPLRRIYIGNPSVLQSYTQGQKEVVITAKTAGMSSLVLWDTEGGRRLYSVSAAIDLNGLRASIEDAFPGIPVKIESVEGKVLLSGTVPSDAASDGISKLTGVYSKDVVNSLHVAPPRGKQVQLKLRIVEVDRTKMEQFGINFISAGKNSGSSTTGQFSAPTFNNPIGTGAVVNDALNLSYFNIPLGLGLTIQDLEEKQILQVLAEPTLTTMSGLPARFLSGGEFPFPVVQGGTGNSTAITIMFRPYGVKVDFTPTVNADGSIRLKVSPEVSTLDYSNAVTISGFTIPALSTRRAETEVEIRDGESFVVSGLLDHRTTDSLSKIPGIAEIPILGQFFKSKSLNRSIVELVVIVTATVVDPLSQPQPTAEPKMVVQNMQSQAFDASAVKAIQTAPPTLKVAKP